MHLITYTSRLLLAAALGLAGAMKALNRAKTERMLRDFGLPSAMCRSGSWLLPIIELVLAGALVITPLQWYGAAGTLIMLVLFTTMIGITLLRGRRPACQCFGALASAPIGKRTVIRNVALTFVAAWLTMRGREVATSATVLHSIGAAEFGVVMFIVVLLAAVVGSVWFAVAVMRQNGGLLKRIEVLEGQIGSILNAHNAVHHRGTRGLPVGSSVPNIAVQDVSTGSRVRLAQVFVVERILVLFVDPNCHPCSLLIQELTEADALAGVEVAVISSGDIDDNIQKFGAILLHARVLLQHADEVSKAFGCAGTPSAVVVESGRIATPIALGTMEVRQLITDKRVRNWNALASN